jgi:hypothetical protein
MILRDACDRIVFSACRSLQAYETALVAPMDMRDLSKLQLFILYLNRNIANICGIFKGGEKIHQAAVVFIGSCLLLFRAFV